MPKLRTLYLAGQVRGCLSGSATIATDTPPPPVANSSPRVVVVNGLVVPLVTLQTTYALELFSIQPLFYRVVTKPQAIIRITRGCRHSPAMQ